MSIKPEFTREQVEELIAADAGMIGLQIASRYLTGGLGISLARDIRDVIFAIRNPPAPPSTPRR